MMTIFGGIHGIGLAMAVMLFLDYTSMVRCSKQLHRTLTSQQRKMLAIELSAQRPVMFPSARMLQSMRRRTPAPTFADTQSETAEGTPSQTVGGSTGFPTIELTLSATSLTTVGGTNETSDYSTSDPSLSSTTESTGSPGETNSTSSPAPSTESSNTGTGAPGASIAPSPAVSSESSEVPATGVPGDVSTTNTEVSSTGTPVPAPTLLQASSSAPVVAAIATTTRPTSNTTVSVVGSGRTQGGVSAIQGSVSSDATIRDYGGFTFVATVLLFSLMQLI